MMDYYKLAAELALPAYTGKSAKEQTALLNARTITGVQPLPMSSFLLWMARHGILTKIFRAPEALDTLKLLGFYITISPHLDAFDLTNAEIRNFVLAFVQAGVIVQADYDDLIALATVLHSRAEELFGLGAAVSLNDIAALNAGEISVTSLWERAAVQGQAYSVSTDAITVSGTNEVDFLLMQNPSAAAKLIRFWEQFCGSNIDSNQQTTWRIYRNPTVTAAGTPLVVNKLLPSIGAVSGTLVSSLPTIGARGTLQYAAVLGGGAPHLNRQLQLSRYLESGSNMLITVQGVSGRMYFWNAAWMEQ